MTDIPQPKSPSMSGPTKSGMIEIKSGTSKFAVPLQGGILTAVLSIAVMAFQTFGQMESDVIEAKTSLKEMAASIGSVEKTLADAISNSQQNASKLETLKSKSEAQNKKLEAVSSELRVRMLVVEKCIARPKRCDL